MSLPPDVPLAHEAPRPDRPIVVAANRLPVMRSGDGWTASPGGLVRALLPMLRDTGGTWVGWTGTPDDTTEPFAVEGVDLHPVPISAEEIELYYEGFSNDALWPLYHDALRESTYSSEQWDAYVTVNERFAERSPTSPQPTRSSGSTTTSCSWSPRCSASDAATSRSASSCTSRSRPTSCSPGCRGAPTWSTGLLGCDLIGFQRPKDAANFAAAAHELVRRRRPRGHDRASRPVARTSARSRSRSTSARSRVWRPVERPVSG